MIFLRTAIVIVPPGGPPPADERTKEMSGNPTFLLQGALEINLESPQDRAFVTDITAVLGDKKELRPSSGYAAAGVVRALGVLDRVLDRAQRLGLESCSRFQSEPDGGQSAGH